MLNENLQVNKSLKQIAIFASGAGSNAEKIIGYFTSSKDVKVALVVCNKPNAGVVQIAQNYQIDMLLVEKESFFAGNSCLNELKNAGIDFIVLAGFLWKIPDILIHAFSHRIINIHPALLPKFGGKGMYGLKVHEAVLAAGEKQSGITIHYVDEHYDNGQIIFQAACLVYDNDTPETLAQRIHKLEHAHYAQVIEACIKKI